MRRFVAPPSRSWITLKPWCARSSAATARASLTAVCRLRIEPASGAPGAP
jgi:hypothetical protein